MTIGNVKTLDFRQDDLLFSPIANGRSNENTWIVKNGESCIIRTRLDTEFFKPSFRGSKRQSLMVEGTIALFGETASFEMELPLQSSRLVSYISGHGIIIAFWILIMLVIGLWAAFVTMANMSRTRPEDLSPQELLDIEEKRLIAIFTIWHQSQHNKTQVPKEVDGEIIHEPGIMSTSETWSTSSSEEEKEEIEPYDEESLASNTPTVFAANNS